MPRTEGDKRRCVVLALEKFTGKTQQEIADHTGVNQSTVQRIKVELMHTHKLPERTIGKDGKSRPTQYKSRNGAIQEAPKGISIPVAERFEKGDAADENRQPVKAAGT